MGIQQPPAGFLKNIEKKKKIRKRSEIYLVSKQKHTLQDALGRRNISI